MRELHREELGDRRVRLLARPDGRYRVTIAVRRPHGRWEDISLVADRDLALHTASLCYRLRLTEQEARAIAWGKTNAPSRSQGRGFSLFSCIHNTPAA